MQKILLAFAAFASVSALAAPVGKTFSGIGVGIDLTTVKYKSADLAEKQATGVNLVADYTLNYEDNFIGLIEGKAKLGSSTLFNDVKQKNQFSVGYAQGYRIGSDLLPYAKVNYSISKLSDIGSFKGVGYGLGAKYAVSNDIEVGAEYLRSNLKHRGTKLKGNAFSFNTSYRF